MQAREWRYVSPQEVAICERFTESAPVQIVGLAQALGVSVVAATLDSGVSGEIKPNPDKPGTFLIRINRHENRYRQRFTVAHEVGHYLLHRDMIGAGISDTILYRSSLSSQVEAQANRVAADLLMPRALIDASLKEFGGTATPEIAEILAERFKVSSHAMQIRLDT